MDVLFIMVQEWEIYIAAIGHEIKVQQINRDNNTKLNCIHWLNTQTTANVIHWRYGALNSSLFTTAYYVIINYRYWLKKAISWMPDMWMYKTKYNGFVAKLRCFEFIIALRSLIVISITSGNYSVNGKYQHLSRSDKKAVRTHTHTHACAIFIFLTLSDS